MTGIETFKLGIYQKKFGEMSSEEALSIALGSEQIARDCGPMDMAYPKFANDLHEFEAYAVLLEKAGK